MLIQYEPLSMRCFQNKTQDTTEFDLFCIDEHTGPEYDGER